MSTPIVTIFVRHTPGCKWAGDEFHKGCNCRKHLRWTHNRTQHRKQAGTRSWAQAETEKRKLESQFDPTIQVTGQSVVKIDQAVKLFLADKKNQGLTADIQGRYSRELDRLQAYCNDESVFTVAGLTRELLVGYQATWHDLYSSSNTRLAVQARLRNFLRFCYDSGYLPRIPRTSRIKVTEPVTMPLTDKEYKHLLDTCAVSFPDSAKATRVRAMVQTMRWSGLAIRDAVTIGRDEIQFNKAKNLYRVVTSRQKNGNYVYVPIPATVAEEILKVLNGNPRYVFWSGNGKEQSAVTNWQHDFRQLFKDAGIKSAGNMMSHRLRDTFACDLLSKGVPIGEVSKLLGHESVKTTEKSYAQWVKSRQDRLDSLVVSTWATE
jgi:integrase/recombinase XerD